MKTSLLDQLPSFLQSVRSVNPDLTERAALASYELSQELLEVCENSVSDCEASDSFVGELFLVSGDFFGQVASLENNYLESRASQYKPPWDFSDWCEERGQFLEAYADAHLQIWIEND